MISIAISSRKEAERTWRTLRSIADSAASPISSIEEALTRTRSCASENAQLLRTKLNQWPQRTDAEFGSIRVTPVIARLLRFETHLSLEAFGVKLDGDTRWIRRTACGAENEDTNADWNEIPMGWKPGSQTVSGRNRHEATCADCHAAAEKAPHLIDAALERAAS